MSENQALLPVIDAEFVALEESKLELRQLEGSVRQLSEVLFSRAEFASMAGLTFNGRRDVYKALGYKRVLLPRDYRERYRRFDIATRLVDIFPNATWRAGGKLTEDEDAKDDTPFEKAWNELNARLDIWPAFEDADIALGWSRFSVIVLGAPGDLDQPLKSLQAKDLMYLSVYGEEDVTITEFDIDTKSPRFGLPIQYMLRRQMQPNTTVQPPLIGEGRALHYTRCIHIAENNVDDRVYGPVRLERGWNTLDDIEKVRGGGSEAYWKRADPGMHLKLDPSIPTGKDKKEAEENLKALKGKLRDFTDGLERNLTTRGVDIDVLNANVSEFKGSVDTLMGLLSSGYGIPQRIFNGSERGELASTQDRANFEERVSDRRRKFAFPKVVKLFVNTMIKLGTLPAPKKPYSVMWGPVWETSSLENAELSSSWGKVEDMSLNERRKKIGLDPYTGDSETDKIADVPTVLQPKETVRVTDPVVPANLLDGNEVPPPVVK